MYKILITLTAIILSFSFSLLSQELEKATITEALTDLSVDRDAVKKLIITGEISGANYSEGSEWRLFRTLDETFPNIEEIELHTKQDIPSSHWITNEYGCGLFNMSINEWDTNGRQITYPSNWLKHFSAPNIKTIGNGVFHSCKNLLSVNFPSAEVIGAAVFCWCENLTEVNFPNIKTIGNGIFHRASNLTLVNFPMLEEADWGVFIGCNNLKSVSFGTGFTEPTTINFGHAVFGDSVNIISGIYDAPVATNNIELILGLFAFPEADTTFNIWQETNYYVENNYDYKWKKITYTSIKEEIEEGKYVYCIGNNRYILGNIVEKVEIFDLMGKHIKTFENQEVIDLNNICSGVYFLKCYAANNKIKVEKEIIIN